jgi:dTDP-4-dehydrorhamnose reductase
MKPRILITGANGMLGSALCTFFQRKASVIALHRDSRALIEGIEGISVDITDSQAVSEVIAVSKPDIIIHCAALINLDQCEAESDLAHNVNVSGTMNLAVACGKNRLFVYISSDQVYGDSSDHTEQSDKLNPINEYGKTKYLGEKVVRDLCARHLIIRTNIFGWNIKPGRISSAEWIYSSLVHRQSITLFDDYIFSPLYTRCLGESIHELMSINAIGIFNIGPHEPCSKYKFGIALGEACALDTSLINSGSINSFRFRASRPVDLRLDTGKYEKAVGRKLNYDDSIKAFAANIQM